MKFEQPSQRSSREFLGFPRTDVDPTTILHRSYMNRAKFLSVSLGSSNFSGRRNEIKAGKLGVQSIYDQPWGRGYFKAAIGPNMADAGSSSFNSNSEARSTTGTRLFPNPE